MEFSIGNISFSKEISKYNDSWYDWRSAEIATPFNDSAGRGCVGAVILLFGREGISVLSGAQ